MKPSPANKPDLMAKGNKKGKGPKGSQNGPKLNEDALSQLTSRIDQNLKGNEHKRKNPPTESGHQDRKRQRNSGNGPAKPASKKDINDALLEEIRALGGDEKDLELIQDIDSSDEYANEDKQPVDKRLKEELAALSKELGFADYQPSEASEEEPEPEEADEDEDDDEDEAIDEDEDEEEDVGEAPRKVEGLVSSPS